MRIKDNSNVFSVDARWFHSMWRISREWLKWVNGKTIKQRTMQFLFLCIYVCEGLRRFQRIKVCWQCGGWRFVCFTFFYLACCRHKIYNKIILNSRLVWRIDSTRVFGVRMTKICPQKPTFIRIANAIQSNKVAPESTILTHLIDTIWLSMSIMALPKQLHLKAHILFALNLCAGTSIWAGSTSLFSVQKCLPASTSDEKWTVGYHFEWIIITFITYTR